MSGETKRWSDEASTVVSAWASVHVDMPPDAEADLIHSVCFALASAHAAGVAEGLEKAAVIADGFKPRHLEGWSVGDVIRDLKSPNESDKE